MELKRKGKLGSRSLKLEILETIPPALPKTLEDPGDTQGTLSLSVKAAGEADRSITH